MTTSIDERRIELVDNRHPRWAEVLELIRRTGGLPALHLGEDGWLAARHILVVGFVGPEPAAYLSMQVQPAGDGSGHTAAWEDGRPQTECRIDCRGGQPGADERLAAGVLSAAVMRAAELHCRGLVDEYGVPVRLMASPDMLQGLHDPSI